MQEIIVEMASRTGDGVYVKRKYPWGLQRYFNDHISISDVVLDLGCGNGELTQMLAEKAKRVVACDRLPSDVKTAQNHHGKDNITYICVDIASYLPAGDYDVAVLSAVLSLVTDPVDLLKRLHAATAKLLIRETKYDYHVMPLLAREFGVPGTYYKLYQKHELMALLDNTGWQVVEEWDSYDLFLSCEAVNG